MPSQKDQNNNLSDRELTWAVLLARWVELARVSVALPDHPGGRRWKTSIVPIITLQSVTMALGEIHLLPHDEQALGLDRAEILIRRESTNLGTTWSGSELTEQLEELITDSWLALRQARRLHDGAVDSELKPPVQ